MLNIYNKKSHQGGVVLLVGLMLLVIMTIIGLVAIRGTTQQEKMSAGNQQQTQTFQAAEAGIRQVVAEISAEDPALIGVPLPSTGVKGIEILVTAISNGQSPEASQMPTRSPVFDSKSGLSASATVKWTGTALVEGSSIGKFALYQFDIDSTASQAGTGAVSAHSQGVGYIGPKGADR